MCHISSLRPKWKSLAHFTSAQGRRANSHLPPIRRLSASRSLPRLALKVLSQMHHEDVSIGCSQSSLPTLASIPRSPGQPLEGHMTDVVLHSESQPVGLDLFGHPACQMFTS